MMKTFNTTGICMPSMHYMVDISARVREICSMVERGKYFFINRPRQYGKTTTLVALETALRSDYAVVSLAFEGLADGDFATDAAFVRAVLRRIARVKGVIPEDVVRRMREMVRDRNTAWVLDDLFEVLEDWCVESDRPVVLIIDEMDKATNNEVFLGFLGQLRQQYLNRMKDPSEPVFQSVILAGVTNVRLLKQKIRPEKQSRPNSPWNIAAPFLVDMSFSVADIEGMLREYEADHATGMDATSVAAEIIAWTGGYPYLCSRLCQIVDESGLGWDRMGISEAARLLLREQNSLFDSLTGCLEGSPAMTRKLRAIIFEGKQYTFNSDQNNTAQLEMLGFVRDCEGYVAIANRIFETRLLNLFLADDEDRDDRMTQGAADRSLFIHDGRLNMRDVLEGFRRTHKEVYGSLGKDEAFDESDGRRRFLLFLKPIINGTGNCYLEAQTRDKTRTDVIVDYAGEQFIVELKIWRGPRYNEKGEEQLKSYLEYFDLSVGYMLSFNFNKKKEPGLKRVNVGDRVLWEETL